MGSPNIGGDLSGTITEGDISIGGDLDDTNGLTTNGDDIFTITAQGSYGTATINSSTGEWTYTLDNTDPAVIALDTGETLTDVFTVNMRDTGGFGSGQSDNDTVTITINGVVCFASGTLIDTPNGPRGIEDLQAGDLVLTDMGVPRRIRWIGAREVSGREFDDDPKLRPVRISQGALGGGLPLRDLVVSRQHRMLVRSKIVERMFGKSDVLIPAIKLTDLPGIYVDEAMSEVTYFHMLFDQHEIVLAEGAPSESLFTGPEALSSIDHEALGEILHLFPEITDVDYTPVLARSVPKGRLQKKLVERHLKSNKPLLEDISVTPDVYCPWPLRQGSAKKGFGLPAFARSRPLQSGLPTSMGQWGLA